MRIVTYIFVLYLSKRIFDISKFRISNTFLSFLFPIYMRMKPTVILNPICRKCSTMTARARTTFFRFSHHNKTVVLLYLHVYHFEFERVIRVVQLLRVVRIYFATL